MYDSLINKMVNHFSEIGSIIYSKSCDFFKLHEFTIDDVEMYYDILCSDEIINYNIDRRNHIMCCLYYLAKDNEDYNLIFTEKYLQTINREELLKKRNNENLIMIFNVIEFDRTYLNSPVENLIYLYSILKIFSSFETDYYNYIIYKYFRGYLKFKTGDIKQANVEYFEIISETMDNEEIFIKYIRILNYLLKVNIYHVTERKTRAEKSEYIQFLKTLFEDLKDIDKTLCLQLGLELFSAYIEGKEFQNCIPLLKLMKSILKKDWLKSRPIKYGIDFYLAIASRLSYMGILYNDKKVILSSYKKIKKGLRMIKIIKDDQKIIDINRAYRFLLANIEIWLRQETMNDIKSLETEFRVNFLPDLKSNAFKNYLINKNNKECIIMDLKIIQKNKELIECSEKIKDISLKEIEHQNLNNNNFIIVLSFYHDEIFLNIKKYRKSKDSHNKNEIINYFKKANDILQKYIDDPFFQVVYPKILVINIYYAYASLLLSEKEYDKLKGIINDMMDNSNSNLRSKLKINESIPSYGLWLKIKGDYYFQLKHYEAAIESYTKALYTFHKNNRKIPIVLFNCGCAYYYIKKKSEALEYLNRSVTEFNNLNINNNYFGVKDDPENIKTKIKVASHLVDVISKAK